LTLTLEEIDQVVKEYEKESKALKKSLLKLCWGMRGSISLDEIYQLSYQDRELINQIIKEHIEVTNETGLPYF
jgi:hypothetical protein